MTEPDAERLAARAASALRELPAESAPDDFLDRLRREPVSAPGIGARLRSGIPSWFVSFPALAAIGVAVLAIGIAIGDGWHQRAGTPLDGVISRYAGTARPVQFVFVAATARRVALVGEFNGWNPAVTPMARTADGKVWTTSLPLAAGRHLYAFVVNDSSWVPDPEAPIAPEAWYGTKSSVLVVADRAKP